MAGHRQIAVVMTTGWIIPAFLLPNFIWLGASVLPLNLEPRDFPPVKASVWFSPVLSDACRETPESKT
jgi:hypothetical protein